MSDEIRPLPESVPPSIREAVVRVLADPELEKRVVSYVLTPTIEHTQSGGTDLAVRMAVLVRPSPGSGWSFSGFLDWRPKQEKDLSAGVEVRFAR